jgi:integrase
MRTRISARFLNSAAAQPKDKPFEVYDDSLVGFLLRVQPSGVRTFYVQLTKGTRIKVGRHGDLTADEARERAQKIKGNHAHGRPALEGIAGASGETLRSFMEDVYTPWLRANRPRGADDSLRRITANFGGWFEKPIGSIGVAELEQWKLDGFKAGRSPATILRDLMSLSGVFTRAAKMKRIGENPVRSVDKPRLDRAPKVRFLDDQEEARLREALAERDTRMIAERISANAWRKARKVELLPELPHFGDHLTPAVLVSMNTGLRLGELLALNWVDVDLKQGLLTVHGATAKTGQTRHVPLNAEARDVLTRWRKHSTGERVFNIETSFKTAWTALLVRVQVSRFRWHDLRHHFASRLAQAGVPLNTIRELLGHGSMAMTIRYAHLAPDTRRSAVEMLGRRPATTAEAAT